MTLSLRLPGPDRDRHLFVAVWFAMIGPYWHGALLGTPSLALLVIATVPPARREQMELLPLLP